jgi:hypothetical protein
MGCGRSTFTTLVRGETAGQRTGQAIGRRRPRLRIAARHPGTADFPAKTGHDPDPPPQRQRILAAERACPGSFLLRPEAPGESYTFLYRVI